jgi:methionyl-tRNA formyltransferase
MTFVVIHADDLGLSRGFNRGILLAGTNGILTSTSIRVNGAAYREAIEEVIPQIGRVGIGLHLNIVEGHTLRRAGKSALCDNAGRFCLGFRALWNRRTDPTFLAEVEAEYRNQIETALKDINGLDHLNSHQHSHGIPELFEIVVKLAAEFKIPFVRLPAEPFYVASAIWRHLRPWYAANLVKHVVLNTFAARNKKCAAQHGVRTNDRFVGILYTGNMCRETIVEGLRRGSKGAALVELLVHPACILGVRDERFLNAEVRNYVINPARTVELSALISPELRSYLLRGGYLLTNYAAIAERRSEQYASAIANAAGPLQAEVSPAPSYARLKTYFILDETPFHQPQYFSRLVQECQDIECCGVAIVKLPHGGVLQKYILKHWRWVGFRELALLAAKQLLLKIAGIFPVFMRGEFDASVKNAAKRLRIPYRVVSQVNTPTFLDDLRKLAPDLIVSSNSLIFRDELLRLPTVACINRHSALLPSYGGILPVFRSVQYGEKFTGASVHFMSKGIDEGEVLSRKWLPIFPNDNLARLYRLCFVLSHEATIEAIAKLRRRVTYPLPLDGLTPSYYSYPTEADWHEFRKQGGRFI